MKRIIKAFISAACIVPLASGCIQEIEPQSGSVTLGQAAAAPGAYDNFVDAITSSLTGAFTYGGENNKYPWDFGYPSFYLQRDVMGNDIACEDAGSEWYSTWYGCGTGLGPGYAVCQLPWTYYYKWIKNKEILNRYSDEDEKILMAKVMDKIEFTLNRNTIENTDFLDLYQKELVKDLLRNIKFSNYTFWGGSETAEREILILYPEKLEGILKREDVAEKLLSIVNVNLPNELKGEYNHRDYLGAIIKLGVKREKVGDIFVRNDGADIIVLKEIEEYLLTNLGQLTRFGKSQIDIKDIKDLEEIETITQKVQVIIPQMRLDCIVSESIRCSRAKASEIIKQERVFVNHKLETKNSKLLKEQDMITIRGKGRFKINTILSRTKKDKIVLEIEKYV